MLWLERRIAASIPEDANPEDRPEIEHFLETSLAAMPQHLRMGVGGLSVLLGAIVRMQGVADDPHSLAKTVAAWETSRIGFVRQYARLMTSLTLFAEQELSTAS